MFVHKLSASVGVSVLLAWTAVQAQQAPRADTAWRYRAPSDIRSFEVPLLCPATTGEHHPTGAKFLLRTEKTLIALDASTGARVWALADPPSMAGVFADWCHGGTGFSYRGDKIVAFDLGSGVRLWDASALPGLREIRGHLAVRPEDLLLLFLRTAVSDRSVAALRLSTGKLLWQRDDLLARSPQFVVRNGVSDITGHQDVITDTDSTLILYVSTDGPIRLNWRSGATVWKAEKLTGHPVPASSDYVAMKLVDSVLVMPRDAGLVGLDARSGRVLWESPASLPAHATKLAMVPSGLLVSAGAEFVNMLDPATGSPRWARPFTGPTSGLATIDGDRYYVVSRGRLLALDLATGDTTGLADLVFDGADRAMATRATENGLLVVSSQALFSIADRGVVAYHRRYQPSPMEFFGSQPLLIRSMILNIGFGSAARREYAYFFTNAPDSSGRTGNSLVRVSLGDGEESGRLWFRERSPDFLFDTARGQLVFLEDDKTIVAVRFPVAPGGASRQP